ncbi:MAG: LysM peptidoglycan-binding domain-containing protein [Acidimicrobiia bacterium]
MDSTSTVQDAPVDEVDDFEDPFDDDEDDEIPAAEPVRTARKAPRPAPNRNPVARWMASRGWRSDYPRWAWVTAAGATALVGLGVIGAVFGDDNADETPVRQVAVPTAATAPPATAPLVDPFVGMPPRHPLVEWVLTGKYDQQVVIANQARTSRDRSGALADPCRLWVGITLRQDGSKVVQLLLADAWSPAFPVPLFIGPQCGRPNPNEFGEVTVPAPNPGTTVPSTTVPDEVSLGPDATVVENPVQQLRSAVAAGTSSTTTAPTTTTTTAPPAPVPLVHYATQGQGMLAVARMYGVTVDELAAVNGIPVDAALTLGQPLVIPGRFQ